MARFNSVTFLGRLGRDPESSTTPTGKHLTKFSLAVDQGQNQDAIWLNIVLWDELATRMFPMLYKGAEVLVSGKLAQRKYTPKEGPERLVTEVIASDCQLLSRREREEAETSAK